MGKSSWLKSKIARWLPIVNHLLQLTWVFLQGGTAPPYAWAPAHHVYVVSNLVRPCLLVNKFGGGKWRCVPQRRDDRSWWTLCDTSWFIASLHSENSYNIPRGNKIEEINMWEYILSRIEINGITWWHLAWCTRVWFNRAKLNVVK